MSVIISVGPRRGVTITVEIHDNRVLPHEKTCSPDSLRPFGRAIRIVCLRGDLAVEDDPAPTQGQLRVRIHE